MSQHIIHIPTAFTYAQPRPHTRYLIKWIKPGSAVTVVTSRRYSEFLELYEGLEREGVDLGLGKGKGESLGRKWGAGSWTSRGFEEKIKQRQTQLESFLTLLITTPALLSHPQILTFLSPEPASLAYTLHSRPVKPTLTITLPSPDHTLPAIPVPHSSATPPDEVPDSLPAISHLLDQAQSLLNSHTKLSDLAPALAKKGLTYARYEKLLRWSAGVGLEEAGRVLGVGERRLEALKLKLRNKSKVDVEGEGRVIGVVEVQEREGDPEISTIGSDEKRAGTAGSFISSDDSINTSNDENVTISSLELRLADLHIQFAHHQQLQTTLPVTTNSSSNPTSNEQLAQSPDTPNLQPREMSIEEYKAVWMQQEGRVGGAEKVLVGMRRLIERIGEDVVAMDEDLNHFSHQLTNLSRALQSAQSLAHQSSPRKTTARAWADWAGLGVLGDVGAGVGRRVGGWDHLSGQPTVGGREFTQFLVDFYEAAYPTAHVLILWKDSPIHFMELKGLVQSSVYQEGQGQRLTAVHKVSHGHGKMGKWKYLVYVFGEGKVVYTGKSAGGYWRLGTRSAYYDRSGRKGKIVELRPIPTEISPDLLPMISINLKTELAICAIHTRQTFMESYGSDADQGRADFCRNLCTHYTRSFRTFLPSCHVLVLYTPVQRLFRAHGLIDEGGHYHRKLITETEHVSSGTFQHPGMANTWFDVYVFQSGECLYLGDDAGINYAYSSSGCVRDGRKWTFVGRS